MGPHALFPVFPGVNSLSCATIGSATHRWKIKMLALLIVIASAATSGGDNAKQLASFCKEKWPTDYRMQEHCADRQLEGMKYSMAFVERFELEADPETKKGTAPMTIFKKCHDDWFPDMAMVSHCLRTQEESAKAVGEL